MNSESRLEQLRDRFDGRDDLYLLFFWVGPVQEFIQEARKMRDLWSGSYLLARATFASMQPCLEHADCEVLLPEVHDSPFYKNQKGCLDRPDSLAYSSLPNHFMVLAGEQHVKDVTDKVRDCLKRFLPPLASEIKGELEAHVDIDGAGLWDFQIEDHFQLMWVGLPIKFGEIECPRAYEARFSDLQWLMEERKLTRTYSPWQGAAVDKCSQCGRREIMTPGPPPISREDLRRFWDSLRKTDRARHKIKEAERLCAVCLTKRLARESEIEPGLKIEGFESTSDIASRPYRKVLAAQKTNGMVERFLQSAGSLAGALGTGLRQAKHIGSIPGDWLYEEGLRYERLRREHSLQDSECADVRRAAEEARETLLGLYGALGQKPSKYYAILVLDADEMGIYLAGRKMPPGKVFSLDWQCEQSRILSALANTDFIDIVRQNDGQTIYSGGDDLLAFGPLEAVFRTAEELRTRFTDNIRTTTSAAVVIVHHQDPLQWAISEARQALERAKEIYRRNSIVISVRLSSGNYLSCGSHWDLKNAGSSSEVSFLNGLLDPLARWMSIDKGLSPAFVHDLIREIGVFYRNDKLSAEMLRLEIDRLFGRHLPDNSPIRVDDKSAIDTLCKSLVHLADPQRQDFEGSTMENTISILRLAAFLARTATEEGR